METFFVTREQFWVWFNRDVDQYTTEINQTLNLKPRSKLQRSFSDSSDGQQTSCSKPNGSKRMKKENKPRNIIETEAATRADIRYSIMYGRHKPGKKVKTWESDGYLSLVGQMAHLCDLRGRMLEEPTILDEIDYKTIEELGELMIGNTEVQVVEIDKT